MWEKYYQLCSSDDFVCYGQLLVENLSMRKHVFEEVIVHHFSIKDTVNKEITSYFTYEELNAL